MVGYSKASLRGSLRNRIFNWESRRKTAVGTNRIIFLSESFDTAYRVEQVQKLHSIQALAAEAFHKQILPRAVWRYIKTRDVRFLNQALITSAMNSGPLSLRMRLGAPYLPIDDEKG